MRQVNSLNNPVVAARVTISVAPSPLEGRPPICCVRSKITEVFPSLAAASAVVNPPGVPPTITISYVCCAKILILQNNSKVVSNCFIVISI